MGLIIGIGAVPAGAATGDVVSGRQPADLGWPPTPAATTGQQRCFDVAGTVIPCAGTGQDGDLQSGAAPPTPRFVVNGDGTVTDLATGLVWLQDASCPDLPGVDYLGRADFDQALAAAAGLGDGLCGLTDGSVSGDWHLPTVRELQSLLDLEYVWPALSNAAGSAQATDGDPFVGVETDWDIADFFWSSTNVAVDGTLAWKVDVGQGSVEAWGKSSPQYVWPVRSSLVLGDGFGSGDTRRWTAASP